MTEIVVGIDGSEAAAHALRWAAAEAKLRDEPLVAVMAWGYLDQRHVDPGHDFDPDYHEPEAHLALASYATAALGPEAVDDVDLRPICDLPARALIDAGRDASLLVVGARGHGGFAGLLLGSVSQKVLHHATCPVAVVRAPVEPNPDGTSERIVVGVDGSDGAHAALVWALDEARRRDAGLDVIYGWQMPFVGPYPYMEANIDTSTLDADARRLLDEAVRRARPTDRDRVTAISSVGGAAGLLLEAAKGADLLVVGTRGLGGVKGALLGSVSHQVSLHASCPVVVVPPSEVPT